MVRGPEQRPQSRLPEGGVNLFQDIKRRTLEAPRGIEILKLSIGQPQGPALESARRAAAEAVLSESESMHEYQDNGSPGIPDFARRFVQAQVDADLNREELDFLPIPGIKPMLGLMPLACGAADYNILVATTTKPGYPTPKDWTKYLRQNVYELTLNPKNEFRFSTFELFKGIDVVMMNYPHNPTGQIASREWLEDLCRACEEDGIRLFNDAAYAALAHDPEAATLSEVAIDFPGLSWAEAFSASKLIGNGTGWRVGAMVGASDFIGDIKTIKGNTDSGFAAPMAAGALFALEHDREGIEENRQMYERRLKLLIEIATSNGMRLAVYPKAGFFSLWDTPREAFGEQMLSAQQFNYTMIENTGLVGVHFEPYIRYAVTSDIEGNADKIDAAFKKARVSYE